MDEVWGVGIDLVQIKRIRRICRRRRKKFLHRVFTEEERSRLFCRDGDPHPRIAARFAAKEAVLKALGCGIGPARLQEVEIISDGKRPPRVKLHGQALRIARRAGVDRVLISLSHEKTMACAQALAVGKSIKLY